MPRKPDCEHFGVTSEFTPMRNYETDLERPIYMVLRIHCPQCDLHLVHTWDYEHDWLLHPGYVKGFLIGEVWREFFAYRPTA